MAWQLLNRVYTIGTIDVAQDITPGAAVTGFRDFTLLSSSNTTYVLGVQGSKWAYMKCAKVGSVLRPSEYIDGSNGIGATVTFDAGTITVFSDLGGSKIVYEDGDGNAQNAESVLRTFSPETLASLKTTPLPSSGKSVVYLRGILADDQKAGFYVWDPDETAAGDDFNYVVSSLSASGRWVRQKPIIEVPDLANDAAAYNGSIYGVSDDLRHKDSSGIVKKLPRVENHHQGEYTTFSAWQSVSSAQWSDGDTFVFRGITEENDLAGNSLVFVYDSSSTNTDALGITHLRSNDISGSNPGRAVLRERSAAPKFANSDQTPSMAGSRIHRCADIVPAAITFLDGMVDGYPYYIFPGAQAQVFTHGVTFLCPGGADFTLGVSDAPIVAMSDNGIISLLGGRSSQLTPNVSASSELTIVSGAITLTQATHTVDTEADAATDELDTITVPSSAKDGFTFTLKPANAGRVVTLKDGTGNIDLSKIGGECRLIKPIDLRWNGSTHEPVVSSPAMFTGSKERHSQYYGITSDGSTDDTSAWNDAIAELNAGRLKHLTVGEGQSVISASAALTSIDPAADDISIIGRGPSSKILIPNDTGNNGTFLTLGTGAGSNTRVRIADIAIDVQNTTASSSGFLFAFTWVNTLILENIIASGFAGFANCGGGGAFGNNFFRNLKVDPGDVASAADAIFYFEDASGVFLDNIVCSVANVVGNTAPAGKIFHISNQGTSNNADTIIMRGIRAQMFSEDDPDVGADGRPYGVFLDKATGTTSSMTNIWIGDCAFDHATIAGIKLKVDAASNSPNSKNFRFRDNRVVNDLGVSIDLENPLSAGNDTYSSFIIDGNYCVTKDDSPNIKVVGDYFDHIHIRGNHCLERQEGRSSPATLSTAAILLDCNNFFVEGNVIGGDEGVDGATRTYRQTAIEIASADADEYTVGINQAPNCKEYCKEPTYGLAAQYSTRRAIIDPSELIRNRSRTRMYRHDPFWGVSGNAPDPTFWVVASGDTNDPTIGEESRGRLNLSPTATGATHSTNGSQAVGPLIFFASNAAPMVYETQIIANDVSDCSMFVGFTDTKALEMPVSLTTTTFTYTATDCVGIIYDDTATTKTFRAVGVNTGAGQNFDTGIAWQDNAYHDIKIVVEQNGDAKFYMDGAYIGQITGAVSNSAFLAPYIGCFSRLGAYTLRADFVNVTCGTVLNTIT